MGVGDLRLSTCGCCEPPAPATPLPVWNRPALDRVDYRVGTYSSFRQAMIQLLPGLAAELAADTGLAEPPLERWTSRDSDDYGIALVEMWATIADILTFYTERYAAEAWLRTAVGRDSIRRLAGLLGYRLNPGVAAGTHLAYTLDEGVALALPVGLRAQSVPKEGEQPQKFETVAAVTADAALNRSPVFGEPETVVGLSAGSDGETLDPGSFVPLPGDPAVLFTQGGAESEERRIAAVDTVDGRPVVRWSAPLRVGHGEAHVPGRGFRLFGHNAPTRHLVAIPQGDPAVSVTWTQVDTEFEETTVEIELDGTIDGIEIGTKVLVITATETLRRTVETVEHVRGAIADEDGNEVMAGAATMITVSGGAIALDRATTRVRELTGRIEPLGWEVPASPISSGTTRIYVPYPEIAAIEKGRVLVLDDASHDPFVAEAAADATPFAIGAATEFLEVTLDGATRDLDAGTAHVIGNVVPATHGETVRDEILGDGDASKTLQEFTLAKSPVTHTADPTAPGGARSSLEVLVDRVRWTERRELFGAEPSDRIYTTWIDDDAAMHVRFGDGVSGARLPTGRANLGATYRQAIGTAGNLDAGQLATALDKPTGVVGVVNPVPASGGVDPESTPAARENAPNTVRTFDRAVSLRDFADLARDYVGVEKAFATWVWDGEERVVHVTVGGEDGAALTAEQLTAVRAYLDQRRDPHRALRIAAYRDVPFVVTVAVEAEPDHIGNDVAAAVRETVTGYFAYDDRRFGQAVHLSDVYRVIHDALGVVSARITVLRYKRFADRLTHGGLGAVLVHAPIFGARHRPDGSIAPAELAGLEATADLSVTVTGGLAS